MNTTTRGRSHEHVWLPTDDWLERACVTQIAEAIGASGYSELYELSLSRPETYWSSVFRYLDTAWRQRPNVYLDRTEGKAFPRWFVGGRLNWVESVLQWAGADRVPGKPAIVAETEDGSVRSMSYATLSSEVVRFATGLRRLGIGRGDRVGLLMENGPEVVVSYLAIAYVGAIVVPLFSGFTADPIVSRLTLCGAKCLITTSGFQRRGRLVDLRSVIEAVRATVPHLEHVIVKTDNSDAKCPPGTIDWRLVHDLSDVRQPEEMDPNDPFMIVFTSGTTGKPKGTVHIHGGFPIRLSHDSAVHWNIREDSTLLWPADIGWIGGHQMIVAALTRGATLVYYDGAPDFPHWTRMPQVIERHSVTHYGSFPTLIRGQAAHLNRLAADMSSVQVLMTAGEVIDPEHFLWFQRTFGRGECPVINYTGGTEASGALLANVVVRPIVPGGFNAISPGVALDVFDDQGGSVLEQIGELVILEPFVGMTQSFWNDRQRYLETYWARFPDVWAHGDLARRDVDGNFFLLGRSDDTLKLAGKRVGPAEIEETILSSDLVIEVAAVGLPDALKGQRLVVFMVRKNDNVEQSNAAISRQVQDFLEERMGRPFRPEAVHVVPELPKNRSRKVMRRLIRDVCMGAVSGDMTSLENPTSLEGIERAMRAGV